MRFSNCDCSDYIGPDSGLSLSLGWSNSNASPHMCISVGIAMVNLALKLSFTAGFTFQALDNSPKKINSHFVFLNIFLLLFGGGEEGGAAPLKSIIGPPPSIISPYIFFYILKSCIYKGITHSDSLKNEFPTEILLEKERQGKIQKEKHN